MAKIVAEKQVNSFVKGLITEASPLTFPENSSLDEENFDLELNGSRKRRLGIDYELGYQLNNTGFSTTIISSGKQSAHKWDFPGGSTTVTLGIVKIDNFLYFLDLLKANPSANLKNNGNPIYIGGSIAKYDIEVSVINGFCIITSEGLTTPVLLSYNETLDVVSFESLTLKVRDIWGVDDGLSLEERPLYLPATHYYNLRNQGWSPRISTATSEDAIDYTFTILGNYPSNADIWTYGKIGDNTSPDFEKYDPPTLVRNSLDNSPAPKGRHIISAFDRGSSRTTESGIVVGNDRELGVISVSASYASRIFYSGVTSKITGGDKYSPNYSGYIFFSQVATGKDKLNKCYQEADPTSPNISDIVDTDGGTIQIPEASKIVKLVATKSSLLVFAENGIWEVYGDAGGFKATSFQLNKVSGIGILNPNAVVEANGSVIYWAKPGIFILEQDQTSGRFLAKNISLDTIQSFYSNLPELTKRHAKGFYDDVHNHIRWIYNDDITYGERNYLNGYTKELNFDIALKAFYKYSISSLTENSPKICSYLPIPSHSLSLLDDDIYVDNDPVYVDTDTVIVSISIQTPRVENYNFLTLVDNKFTVSKYRNLSFMDWQSADGVGANYLSFLLTGYELFGDVLRKKQVPYILFYLERTEDGFTEVGGNLEIDNPSSCLVSSQWNWTNSINSGKWGQEFQVYRLLRPYIPSGAEDAFDYGDRVIVTKNRLRGMGRALSILIKSEQGKDLQLLGWAMKVTGNTEP